MSNNKLIGVIFFLLLSSSLFPQLKDTILINKNLRIADKLLEKNTDSAIAYIKKSAVASKELKYIYGVAKSNSQLVRYYMLKGLNDSSSYFTSDAIKYALITKDTTLIISTYLLSSRALSSALQYNKALELCLKAQKFAESKKNIKYKIKIAHDLGYIHSSMLLHGKAILYYKEGLKLSEQEKDTFNFANISARLAGEYSVVKKYDTAMIYNKQSLKYFTLIKHKRGIGVSLVNLAENYNGLKQYDKAIETTLEAIKIRTELGDSYAITILKNNLASCYLKKKNYKKALEAAKESEELSKQQNDIALQIENYSSQYLIYYNLNNFEKAFDYAYRYINLKDSVNQSTNLATLTELQTRYETDQKEKEIKLLQLENKNAEERSKAESTKRNIILFSTIAGLLLVMIFAGFMYSRYKTTQKQKHIIELKEKETQEQKNLIEEKQKEILDSINYAKRIQYTLLAHDQFLKDNLNQHFTYFNPKDIVSGDFYWAAKQNNKFYLAVCDSTGHGVPGAFMSLLNIGFLSEAINEKGIEAPNKVFEFVRMKLTETISKEGQQDGFDGILLCINKANNSITYSAANNAPILIKSKQVAESEPSSVAEIIQLSSDRMPVGIGERKNDFKLHTIEAKAGDMIYLYTDGFADQFGGPKGKKFMYKQLENLLISISHESMEIQKQKLEDVFENWKGDLEQVDDVCMIGVRI